MEKSNFRGRKVAQVHVRNPQKFLYLIFIGMQLDFFFEFLARLWVTFFLIVLEIGVPEKAVSAGILRIKPDRLAKFRDSLLRDLGHQVGPAKQHMQRRRFSHRGVKLMEPRRGFGQLPCLQIGNPKKIAGFEIILEIYRSLQLLDRIIGIPLEHVDSTEESTCPGMARLCGHKRFQQRLRFGDLSVAEPNASCIQLSFDVIRLEPQRGF